MDFEPASLKAEIGFSLLRFNYTEYSDTGTELDREHGVIPGASFRLAQRRDAWEWEGRASYHREIVDYTGHTQAGLPYNTSTDEVVSDYALRLGHWFAGSYPLMPYAGLGYRRWNRDILPGKSGGLFESYRWKYFWLGTKVTVYQQPASDLMLDIGWLKPIDPVMEIKGSYNDPSLDLGSRGGLRLMLASHHMIRENTTLTLEPYFEYWPLGRSPTIKSGGYTLNEPESVTRNFGLNMRMGRAF